MSQFLVNDMPYPSCPSLPSSDAVAGFSASIIFGILATVAVVLRLLAQRKTQAGITIDTYLIIASLILSFGICALASWMALCAGLGWSEDIISPDTAKKYYNGLDAHQILWAITVACIRASILLFYRRIFITSMFRKTVAGVLCFNTLYLFIFVIITALSFSIPQLRESTLAYSDWLIANGIIDMAQDLLVLCLPVFVIRKLQMSWRQKVGLIALFWLGVFCVVASIARVVYFVKFLDTSASDDEQHDWTGKCIIWSTIQPCTSVVAACFPTFAPLFRGKNAMRATLSSKFTSLLRSVRRDVSSYETESNELTRDAKIHVSQTSWIELHDKNSSEEESRMTAREAYETM